MRNNEYKKYFVEFRSDIFIKYTITGFEPAKEIFI